jgi:hypothetical protein
MWVRLRLSLLATLSSLKQETQQAQGELRTKISKQSTVTSCNSSRLQQTKHTQGELRTKMSGDFNVTPSASSQPHKIYQAQSENYNDSLLSTKK